MAHAERIQANIGVIIIRGGTYITDEDRAHRWLSHHAQWERRPQDQRRMRRHGHSAVESVEIVGGILNVTVTFGPFLRSGPGYGSLYQLNNVEIRTRDFRLNATRETAGLTHALVREMKNIASGFESSRSRHDNLRRASAPARVDGRKCIASPAGRPALDLWIATRDDSARIESRLAECGISNVGSIILSNWQFMAMGANAASIQRRSLHPILTTSLCTQTSGVAGFRGI
jgi:hypothetical protein